MRGEERRDEFSIILIEFSKGYLQRSSTWRSAMARYRLVACYRESSRKIYDENSYETKRESGCSALMGPMGWARTYR